MRSFLTVLGVIIGTGTIIGVGSIIAGPGWRDHGHLIRSFGPNTMIVFKFGAASGGEPHAGGVEAQAADARRTRGPSPSAARRWSTSAPILFPDRSGAFDQARYKGNECTHRYGRHRGRLRRRAAPRWVRPLLHRRRKPAPHAGGGDRRGHRTNRLFPDDDPIGQDDRGDGPRSSK